MNLKIISLDSTKTYSIPDLYLNIGHLLDHFMMLIFAKAAFDAGREFGLSYEEIIVYGTLLDQYLKPIEGALIEIWQANAAGKYLHMNDKNIAPIDPNFAGCGRYITSSNGAYEFITIQPGPYPYPNRGIEWRPMHIHFSVFGKSFGQRLITQMYFEGDPLIKLCPMVNSIPDTKARASLIASLDTTKSNTHQLLFYKFDIILRGIHQTYFENRKEGL